MEILEASINRFNGVVIDPAALPSDPAPFGARLRHSLDIWRTKGYWLVWLELPIAKSALIPVAVEAGFGFHHTADGYLMLTYRLDPTALIPGYATHFIGAGGVVINPRQELLVVVEKYRSSQQPYYKLPGGALHPGEHLADAVVREIYEETGVRARFDSLVCLRHWHGYRYGKSDIYFICRLSPLSEEITIHDGEIDECLWMPLDTYLKSEYVALFNKRIVEAALEGAGVVPTWVDGYTDPSAREFFMPPGLVERYRTQAG